MKLGVLRFVSRSLALLLIASTLSVVPFVAPVSAQDYVEWECDGIPILMRGGHFHYIVPDPDAPGELTIEEIAGTNGIWNSTAHDPLNNLVYGVGTVAGEKTVRAYDATGAIIFETQIQDPYPDNAATYAGTVLGDGRYIIHSVGAGNGNGWFNGARFNLWSIDTATGAATYIGPTPVNFADFSYNPLDGYLYQAVNRVLYQVDPNTGATTTAPTSTVLPNGSFGASWFDAAGNLYLFRNSPGDIWKVDPADPSNVVLVGEVGADGGTEGTNCISSLDIKKDVVDGGSSVLPEDRVYSAGDTVTYEIELINNGVPTQNRTVDLCDVLPAGMTYTGVWSSTDPGASIASGLTSGSTDFCAQLDMPSSLFTDPANPGSPPTTFTFEVLLGDDIVPGEHENQATLDFDQDGTVDLLSDDPGDGSDPSDPTTVDVLGSMVVSKTVVGHPVDNDTDEFPVVLSCTNADGSTYDVDATQIVDANTGAAWPSATTNGFTMSNGDEIEVVGLPAGTMCVITEDSSTSYTSTVVVEDGTPPADDGTGDDGGGDGATSTGTLTTDLVNDNCQDGDGGFVPFNLQVRNTTNTAQDWETIWRNRPYDTIPNLNPGNYTHTVIPTTGGLYDHVFTGTTPLNPFGNITITGGVPNPLGSDQGCGDVENYNGVGADPGTGGGTDPGTGGDGAVSTGTLTTDLVNDNCQDGDGGFVPFNLQVRNTTNTAQDWETIWRNRPYDTIPNLNPGNYTHTVIPTTGGLYDHVFTGTTPLNPFGNITITGGVPNPLGSDQGCGDVENYNGVTGPATGGGSEGEVSNSGELTVDSAEESIAFTNATSTIDLRKGTSVAGDLPLDQDGTFRFDLTCTNGFSETVTITTSGGSDSISYPDTPLLPAGVTCTASENVPAGWTLTSPNDVEVATEAGTAAGVTFLNERELADLTISKTVLGLPAGQEAAELEFEVMVTCTGGFDPDPYSVTSTFGVGSPFVVEDLPVGAECTVTETPVDGFNTRYAPSQVVTIDADGEAVQITNSTGSLIIEKTTSVPATHPIDPVDSFEFTLECAGPGGSFTETYVVDADSLIAGGATGGVSHTEVGVIAPGTTCEVTESDASPEWTVDSASQTIEITEDNPEPTASFINTRTTGSLTVTKTIEGLPDGVDLGDEPFTVDVSCSGGFTVDPYLIAGQTITANTPLLIPDLPTGAVCTVTEQADPRFTATGSPSTVTIDADGETVAITNTTSSIEFQKRTVASDLVADADGTFDFDLICTFEGSEIVNITTSITTASGQGTALAADLPLVPPGTTCTITEIVPAGWTISNRVAPALVGTDGIEFTTPLASNIGFENTLETATLTIDKDVTGLAATPDLEAETFTVTVECTGNFDGGVYNSGPLSLVEGTSIDIDGLPVGAECTVTETADSRFATTYTPDQTFTVVDGPNEVLIENETSTFTISKATEVPAGVDPDGSFEFAIECTSGGAVVYSDTVSIDTTAGAGSWDAAPFVPPETLCSVAENAPTGWAPVGSGEIEITTSGTAIEDAAFTNARDVAELTITKGLLGVPDDVDLDGDPATANEDEEFTVNVSCVGDFAASPLELTGLILTVNDPLTIPDLPTGTECTVTEDFDSRFQALYSPENADGSAAVVTVGNDGAAAGITNAGGVLAIRKDTLGPADHPLDLLTEVDYNLSCNTTPAYNEVWTVDVNQTAGGQGIGGITWTELPVFPLGTVCTVTEIVPEGWTLTSPNPQVVTVQEDPETTEWVNTSDVGALTVTKTLEGVPAGTVLDGEPFTVDVSCTGGGLTVDPYEILGETITANTPLVIDNLPTGATCSVEETADPRFSTSIDAPVDIDTDGETINITNTTSTFSITKTTEGPTTHPLDLDATFTFNTECAGPDGTVLYAGTQTITTTDLTGTWATPNTPLLPPGTTCEVTEQTPPTGWTNTTGDTENITTDSDTIQHAAFTNQRDTDTLTITKTLAGVPEGIDLSEVLFDITVTCSNGFTTSEHIITGQVSSTTPLVVEDLPTGATCEVTEANDARFLTTYDPANAAGDAATSTIAIGGNDVGITNSTGAVIVAKETIVSALHPIDPVDEFTFTIDCGAVYLADHTLTTDLLTPTGATGVIFYTDLPLIPEGTVCDITELDETPEWTLSSDRTVTLTASSASPVTAEFVNTRTLGSLTINKLVEGPDNVDLSAEEFDVTVTCSGGFTEDPYVLTGTISEVNSFAIDELPYGAECSVEESPDFRFASTIAEPDATITELLSEIDVLNQTGSFVVGIESIVNSVFPLDPDDDFEFVIIATLPDGTVVETIVDITTLDGNGQWESPLFPTGTVLTVTLEASDEWTLIDRDGNPVGNAGIELTIGTDVSFMGFQVERALSSLTISKDLANIPTAADFSNEEFDVVVTCTNGFEVADYELPGAFSVTDTTPIVIADLPVGATCEVVEEADEFFEASYSQTTITIVEDASVNGVTITNTGNEALRQSVIDPGPLAFTGRTVFATVWFAVLMIAVGAFLLIGRRSEDEELA